MNSMAKSESSSRIVTSVVAADFGGGIGREP